MTVRGAVSNGELMGRRLPPVLGGGDGIAPQKEYDLYFPFTKKGKKAIQIFEKQFCKALERK